MKDRNSYPVGLLRALSTYIIISDGPFRMSTQDQFVHNALGVSALADGQFDEKVPRGIVLSRIRQLQNIVDIDPQGQTFIPELRDRESTWSGWGRRADSGFAQPASRNRLDEDLTLLPLPHVPSHTIGADDSRQKDQEYLGKSRYMQRDTIRISEVPPALRSSVSAGHLRVSCLLNRRSTTITNLHGISEQWNFATEKMALHARTQHELSSEAAPDQLPRYALSTSRTTSPIDSEQHSNATPTNIRRQNAIEMFQQYGISQPSG
jgi:hypothetical protein